MSDERARSGTRSEIFFTGPTPAPEEAAAVAAAIERFAAETAPPLAPAEPAVNPWQRAALYEGVMAKRQAFPAEPGSGFPLV